jgi:phosphate transport system permease protein
MALLALSDYTVAPTVLEERPVPREISTTPRLTDRIFRGVVTGGGFTSMILLGLIAVFLGIRSIDVFAEFGLSFITGFSWQGASEDGSTPALFGVGAMLVGTLVTSFIAMVIAVPISVGMALFLVFYAPNFLKRPATLIVDLMAAIPSVIFGLWGYFILMPHAVYWAKLLNKYFDWIPLFEVPFPIFERSPFIASIVLAVMITPIITAVSREVFSQTPRDRIEAAYALGATKWATIRTVALPFGRGGVVGGAMLGLGRALGETVAVYLVLNLVYQPNFKILQSAGGNIASMIVNKFGEANAFEVKGLMAAGLTLFVLTLVVNAAANAIVRRTSRTGGA